MVQQRARRLPAEKRKRQIIESARAVFASQSYAKVGTADLAKAAGISEPALYRHFAGKKELFVATLRATAPRLLKVWEEISVDYEDPIETLWAIGVYYYDHLDTLALGPNVASFAGHSAIRAHVMGIARSLNRDVKPERVELAAMEHLLQEALDTK